MPADKAIDLRKPFPAESIGRLPKGGVMLDYVGHAAVTDRLLMVDPEWSWEPFSLDPNGLPALDSHNNLWIRLTICGVTRIGVGDGKSAKEVIGDAIRNAAMRFGVALDLWAKEDLVEFRDAATGATQRPAQPEPVPEHQPDAAQTVSTRTMSRRPRSEPAEMSKEQLTKIMAQFGDLGVKDRTVRLDYTRRIVGRDIGSSNDLTGAEAHRLIEALDQDIAEARNGA
jgi:hypothetical protein